MTTSISEATRPLARIPCLSVITLTFSLLLQLPAQAQVDPKLTAAFVVTKAQQAQLQRVMKNADVKVEAGFKGQEKLKEEMLNQLKAISALKNSSDRAKAAGAYRSRYKKGYADVLAKGGLNMQELVGQLRPIFPHLVIQLTDDLAIVGSLRDSASDAPPPSAISTSGIGGSFFEITKDRSCGLAAGGDVSSTSSSIMSTALAAIAGGCFNHGEKFAIVPLPAERKSASIRTEGDLSAEAFAAGVGVSAASNATAMVAVTCGSASDSAITHVLAFAPIAWVASEEQERTGVSRRSNAGASVSECRPSAYVFAGAIAGLSLGEAHSAAQVKRFEASVTIER